MASKLPNGLGSVAITPGYSVGIKLEYCSLTAIRTTSNNISATGAKRRAVRVAADTTAGNFLLNSQKTVPLGRSKVRNVL